MKIELQNSDQSLTGSDIKIIKSSIIDGNITTKTITEPSKKLFINSVDVNKYTADIYDLMSGGEWDKKSIIFTLVKPTREELLNALRSLPMDKLISLFQFQFDINDHSITMEIFDLLDVIQKKVFIMNKFNSKISDEGIYNLFSEFGLLNHIVFF